MASLAEFISEYRTIFMLIQTLLIVVLVGSFINYLLRKLKVFLLNHTKKKKQRSNIEIFYRIINYGFIVLLVLIGFFSYFRSWTSLGLTVGLISAAIGWALQKPITGMAAWIMVVIKRPFEIGDRIIIGEVRGDVVNVTLTHLYINEIGGLVDGEETSGRTVMVPNSLLFEKNIINYTSNDDYVLSQVIVQVTYESNLDKAMEIAQIAALKHTQKFVEETGKPPYVRTFFEPSGIDVHVRYFCPARGIQEVASDITQEIFKQVKKAKNVEIAYPHTQLVMPHQSKNSSLFNMK